MSYAAQEGRRANRQLFEKKSLIFTQKGLYRLKLQGMKKLDV
jgi:hypothetical protein